MKKTKKPTLSQYEEIIRRYPRDVALKKCEKIFRERCRAARFYVEPSLSREEAPW